MAPPAAQSLLFLVYTYVFPLVLVGAAVFKDTISSFFYLVGFIAVLLVQPDALLKWRKFASLALCGALVLWSVSVLITELILWIMETQDALPSTENAQEYIPWIVGYYAGDKTVLQYFQMVLPDSLVAVTSSVMALLVVAAGFRTPNVASQLSKGGSFTSFAYQLLYGVPSVHKLRDRFKRGRMVSVGHQYLTLILCLTAGILFSSITTIIFLLVGLASLVFVAFGVSIDLITSLSWPFLMLVGGLDLMYMYLAQFEYNGTDIAPIWVSGTDGAVTWMAYDTWEWSEMWYIFAEFAVLIMLFFMVSHRLKMRAVGKAIEHQLKVFGSKGAVQKPVVSSPDEDSPDPEVDAIMWKRKRQISSLDRIATGEEAENPLAKKFLANYGWQTAFFFYMISCCLTPSLLQAPVLFWIMFGGTLMPVKLIRASILPLFLYSTLFLLAQALYCIPFWDDIQSDILENLGFVLYSPVAPYLGMQVIPIFILALSWHNRKFEKSSNSSEVGTERELLLPRDSSKGKAGSIVPVPGDEIVHAWDKSKRNVILAGRIVWTFILRQAYLISLLAVMLCSLSSVNLFNLCYMLFFLTFFVSRKAAHKLWILLVLYTEAVIMVEFLWQMTWTEDLDDNTAPELFGLTHFDLLLKGIGFHIAIWVFAVIQLWIVRQLHAQKKAKKAKRRDELQKQGEATESDGEQDKSGDAGEARIVPQLDLPPKLAYAKQLIQDLLPTIGLGATYLLFFTVGVIPEYDCFKLSYILVVYACLLLHMLFEDARTKIRWFWPGVVVMTLVITLALYFYQFPQIASWLQGLWPSAVNEWFTLEDLGLHELEDLEQYIALLGTSLVFVASVLQLSSFIATPKTQNHSQFERIAEGNDNGFFHWVRTGLFLGKRFLILHMFKITLLGLWFTAISSVSLLNLGFALFAVWALFFWQGPNTVGIIILAYAQVCTLVSFAVEFDGVNKLLQDLFFPKDVSGERYENFLDYLGVEVDGDLFLEVAWFNAVMLLLLIERVASRWRKDADIVQLHTRNGEACPLFLVTKDQFETVGTGEVDAESPLLAMERVHAVRYRLMWYASNFYRLFGIIVFTLSLLLTIFLRVNVWSIVEIFIVGACVLVPNLVKKYSPFLLIALGFLLIWEYVSYLGLPDDLWNAPWADLPQETLAWLTFGGANYNIYLTLTDYVTLLFLMFLYRNEYFFNTRKEQKRRDRMLSEEKPAEVLESEGEFHLEPLDNPLFKDTSKDQYILEDASADDDPLGILATSLAAHQAPDNTFEFNSFGDRVLYFCLRYSLHLIMVCIFMFATVQANLLSAGYVIFSLFFLYYDELLYQKRNKIWNWVRFYNFLVLLAQICFQCPYFPYSGEPYSAQQIIGLYKYDDLASVFSSTGVIFDIIIFVLVTVQATVFESHVFVRIANEVHSQRVNAIVHAQKRYREFLALEEEALEKIESEKRERHERLRSVKEFRKRKRYLDAEDMIDAVEVKANREWQDLDPSSEVPLVDVDSPKRDPSMPSITVTAASAPSVVSRKESDVVILADDEDHNELKEVEDFARDEDSESDSDSDSEEKKKTLKDKVMKKLTWAVEAGYNALVSTLFKIGGRDPDPSLNKAQTIGLGTYYLIVSKSHYVCYVLFILNNLVYGSVLSQLFFLLTFGFALLERPQPARGFWRWMLFYVNILLIAKFIFQVTVFCVCYATFDWYLWCVEPLCSNDDYCSDSYQDPNIVLRDLPRTFGIEKIDGVFVFGVAFDLLVLVLLLIHRNNMKVSGNWLFLTELWEKSKLEYFVEEQERTAKAKKEKEEKKRAKEAKKRRTTLKKYKAKLIQRRTELMLQKEPTDEVDEELERVRQKLRQKAVNNEAMLPVSSKPSSVALLFQKIKNKVKRNKGTSDQPDASQPSLEPPRELQSLSSSVEQIEVPDGEEEAEVFIEDVLAEASDVPPPPLDAPEEMQVVETDEEEKAAASTLNEMGKAKQLWWNIKYYYHNLFSQHATASDYYVAIATVEVLCFFYMLLCQNTFTYQPPDGWTFILLENSVPTSFFFLLLIQFIFIVADRTVYIYRSVRCKVLMQYVTLAYYLAVLFYLLPSGHQEPFQDEFFLMVFYLMKCLYWWISALQIADGYPPNIQKRWLTKGYSQPKYYIYQVYMLIPFLFEMRSLLDWTVHETTLRFLDWMKLEDIYSSLYMTKCKREKEKKENFLEKRGKVEKLTQGLLVFVGIVVLLWFPLFLLSSANPATTTNGVTEVDIEISVVGWDPLFSVYQDEGIVYATNDDFDLIRQLFPFVTSDEEDSTQILTLTPYSSTSWQATPPSQRSLGNSLLDTEGTPSMDIQVRITFHRPQPTDQQVVVTDVVRELSSAEREALYETLAMEEKVGGVIIPNIIPAIVDVKLDGSVLLDSDNSTFTSILLSMNRTIAEETVVYRNGTEETTQAFTQFWTVLNAEYNQTSPDGEYVQSRYPQIVIISDEVPLFFSASLAASGIIGIYFAIVLVIGQFLRGYVSDLQTKLIFTEMPEPIDLITMCEDIFIAREDKELVLERELYNELIELYRSPESLIAMTRKKVKQD